MDSHCTVNHLAVAESPAQCILAKLRDNCYLLELLGKQKAGPTPSCIKVKDYGFLPLIECLLKFF